MAFNYLISGTDPLSYHIANVLIHSGVGIVVFLISFTTLILYRPLKKKLKGNFIAALSTSALFICHPLATNVVNYTAERNIALVTLFSLSTVLFYVYARVTSSFRAGVMLMAGAIISLYLALNTKETALILPGMVLIYEALFLSNRYQLPKTSLLRNWGLILMFSLSAYYLIRYLGQDLNSITPVTIYPLSFGERILTESRALVHYLSLVFWPSPERLRLAYDFPVSHSLLQPLSSLLALVAIILSLVYALLQLRRDRITAFAIFWFWGNLFLESYILQLHLIFEKRIYPALWGPLFWLGIKFWDRSKSKPWLSAALMIALISTLAFWSMTRNFVWRSEMNFWQDAVAKAPHNLPLRLNLIRALLNENRLREATRTASTLTAQPHLEALVIPNLAMANLQVGRLKEALQWVEKGLKHPEGLKRPFLLELKGLILQLEGNPSLAIDAYRQSLELEDNPWLRINLGKILRELQKREEARQEWQKAYDSGLRTAPLLTALAEIFEQTRDWEKAADYAVRAQALDPCAPSPRRLLTRLRQKAGDRIPPEAALCRCRTSPFEPWAKNWTAKDDAGLHAALSLFPQPRLGDTIFYGSRALVNISSPDDKELFLGRLWLTLKKPEFAIYYLESGMAAKQAQEPKYQTLLFQAELQVGLIGRARTRLNNIITEK